MSVAKTIEISASSDKSFEDAVHRGVERAASTLNDVRSAWVKDQEVKVENGKVTDYKVHLKVTFVMAES